MFLNDFFKDAPRIEISQLSCDSRLPMKNAIYFCLTGVKYDGHDFIKEAIENGAVAIVYSKDIDTDYNCIFIKVNDCFITLNNIADKFYNYPSKDMDNYLVCGCYLKKIISTFIFNFLKKYQKCGYIGENGIIYDDIYNITSYRTLPILDNIMNLKKMKENDISSCIFESSVNDLSYHKLDSINPKIFIYTNTDELSYDFKQIKFDYYDKLKNYVNTLSKDVLFVLNGDDNTFDNLFYASHPNFITYGIDNDCDVCASNISYYNHGTIFVVKYKNQSFQVKTKLIGKSNVYSILAFIATFITKYSIEDLVSYISELEQIEGKCEYINLGQNYNCIIDKAYTLNSIKHLVLLCDKITSSNNKKIFIVSADSTVSDDFYKKYLSIIERYADLIIVTISNSFKKDSLTVIKSLSNYITNTKYLIIDNRECAIECAIELLNKNDTLAITGLGSDKNLNLFLGRTIYDGDSNIAKKYIEKRLKEENEIIEIY